jgi:hypothetical protein
MAEPLYNGAAVRPRVRKLGVMVGNDELGSFDVA